MDGLNHTSPAVASSLPWLTQTMSSHLHRPSVFSTVTKPDSGLQFLVQSLNFFLLPEASVHLVFAVWGFCTFNSSPWSSPNKPLPLCFKLRFLWVADQFYLFRINIKISDNSSIENKLLYSFVIPGLYWIKNRACAHFVAEHLSRLSETPHTTQLRPTPSSKLPFGSVHCVLMLDAQPSLMALDRPSIILSCFQARCSLTGRVPVTAPRDVRDMYSAIPANHEL